MLFHRGELYIRYHRGKLIVPLGEVILFHRQGLSQYLETGRPKLAIVKYLGILFSTGEHRSSDHFSISMETFVRYAMCRIIWYEGLEEFTLCFSLVMMIMTWYLTLSLWCRVRRRRITPPATPTMVRRPPIRKLRHY